MTRTVDVSKVAVQVVRNALDIKVELLDILSPDYQEVTVYPIVDEYTGQIGFIYYDTDGYSVPLNSSIMVRKITVNTNHSNVEQLNLFIDVFLFNELQIDKGVDRKRSAVYSSIIKNLVYDGMRDPYAVLLGVYREFVKKLLNIYPVLLPVSDEIIYKPMSSAREVYCIVKTHNYSKGLRRPPSYVLAVTPVFSSHTPYSLLSNPDYDSAYKQALHNQCILLSEDKQFSKNSMELIYI